MVGKLRNSRGDIALYKKARGVHSVMNFGGIAQVDAARFKSGNIIKIISLVDQKLGGDLITQTYYSIQKVRNGIPGSSSAWLFDVLPATRMDFNNQKSSEMEHRDLLGECERVGIMSGLCSKASVSALKEMESEREKQEECVSMDLPNASLMYGCDKDGIKNMKHECSDFGMSIDPTATGERHCNSENVLIARKESVSIMSRKLFLLALVILGLYLLATKTKIGKRITKILF
jgi:hypothetical protein